jgi:hypothetical protein
MNLYLLVLDVQPQAVVDTHVLVCDPDHGKECDHVSTPAGIQKLEASNDKEHRGDVVTEAIFTSKEVEEFAPRDVFPILCLPLTIVARLAKYFFVCNRPGDAGDRYRQNDQPHNLESDRHSGLFDTKDRKAYFALCRLAEQSSDALQAGLLGY